MSKKSESAAVSSEIPVDVVVEAKEESKVEVSVDHISDPPPPNSEAVDSGAAPTGSVTVASIKVVGIIPSIENVVMDDAAIPPDKPVDAVMSNVSAEVVAVDQCP